MCSEGLELSIAKILGIEPVPLLLGILRPGQYQREATRFHFAPPQERRKQSLVLLHLPLSSSPPPLPGFRLGACARGCQVWQQHICRALCCHLPLPVGTCFGISITLQRTCKPEQRQVKNCDAQTLLRVGSKESPRRAPDR